MHTHACTCTYIQTHTHTHTHMPTHTHARAHTRTALAGHMLAHARHSGWGVKTCGLKKVLQAEDLRWADGRWRNLLSISTWVELVRQNTGGWDQRDRREGAWFLIDLMVRRRILYEKQDSSGSQCGAQRIRDNYHKLCGQTWQNV